MAIAAPMVWAMDPSGSTNNGGGYDGTTYPGGSDLSTATTSALSPTDLDCNNNTNLHSTAFTFTTAMVGNVIAIRSGTNFTKGFYVIAAFVDAHNVTLDRNPTTGAAASVGVGEVGGARSTFADANINMMTALVAGNIVWVKTGSYTQSVTFTSTAGTATANVFVLGFKTSHGDTPTGTDRPDINLNNIVVIFGNYHQVSNLYFHGGSAAGTLVSVATGAGYSIVFNCKFNATNTGNTKGIVVGSHGRIVGCEATASSATGSAAQVGIAIGCYFHDTGTGWAVATTELGCFGCIFDTLTTGASSTNDGMYLLDCTFYNCGTGINTTGSSGTFLNNIISTCTTGISCNAANQQVISNYNCFNGNGANYSNVAAGGNDIVADPLLNDPANGDFTLKLGSPARAAAIQNSINTGAVGTYYQSIGVDQRNLGLVQSVG